MKKKSMGQQLSPTALVAAEKALQIIAKREGISVDHVRKHIQLAMLNGLVSNDPQIQTNWACIPRQGGVPTPEELVAACAVKIKKK